jgi:hypothetical protein
VSYSKPVAGPFRVTLFSNKDADTHPIAKVKLVAFKNLCTAIHDLQEVIVHYKAAPVFMGED